MSSPLLASAHSLVGLVCLSLLAYLFSTNRRAAKLRIAALGIASQLLLAIALTRLPFLQRVFDVFNDGVLALQDATMAGTTFVFGFLGGGTSPYLRAAEGSDFVLAFRALPLILVLSALTALLNYWGILPFLIRLISRALQRSFRIGGAVALAASANIFLGMTESPLFIRPYLKRLSDSELFIIMCTGMATIAGTVLVIYVGFLSPVIERAASHLLIASIISIPAAIAMALLLVPSDEVRTEAGAVHGGAARSAMGAVSDGAEQGLHLCLNIAAMLIVLIALVTLANLACASFLPSVDGAPLSLQRMLGLLMAPLAWLSGIPWHEALGAGQFLGTKFIINEFVAYREFAAVAATEFSPRTQLIMLYALSGFANIGSLGIMIGGLGTMAPERKQSVIRLGPRALLGGTLATLSTGGVVGLLALW